MDHLDNAPSAALPACAADAAASELERMGLGACADLSAASLLAAAETKLSAMSAETGLSAEWHSTAMSLKNAAGLLYEAAENIASGDHAAGVPSWRIQAPEQGVEWALSCIRRVYDGEAVRPVLPL